VGDRYYEAFVLGHLGDTHYATGAAVAARNAWETALDVFTRFGHPDAAELRKKIDGLSDPNGHRTRNAAQSRAKPDAPMTRPAHPKPPRQPSATQPSPASDDLDHLAGCVRM
jgi:hypothetical protein